MINLLSKMNLKWCFLGVLFLNYGITLSQNEVIKGKLNQSEISFIKENYKWSNENLLIVNYIQPRYKCHYNNYARLESVNRVINNFFSDVDLEDKRLIFVYGDISKAKTVIDNKKHFADTYYFFSSEILKNKNSCYGVFIVNKPGQYSAIDGEYLPEQIAQMVSDLQI